ncbi:VOC family protein [Caulobacter sp. NIBR2454]|uniref:VOC family protein n=1 Tax=Caulobacter sp. NIBR2454 TaxID=3015996 RepID=UPI0022B642C2|nr:VOC family protein [Caulobacter sp. NIBR2454]
MQLLVNIDVPDLEAATAFYRDGLGLTVGRRFGKMAVEMIGGSSPLYLLKKAAGSVGAAEDKRRYERHWSPVHLDFIVEDVDAASARAVAAGAKVEQGAEDTPYGRLALFADPFGHGFCLLQFTGAGYDAIAD